MLESGSIPARYNFLQQQNNMIRKNPVGLINIFLPRKIIRCPHHFIGREQTFDGSDRISPCSCGADNDVTVFKHKKVKTSLQPSTGITLAFNTDPDFACLYDNLYILSVNPLIDHCPGKMPGNGFDNFPNGRRFPLFAMPPYCDRCFFHAMILICDFG